MNKSCRLITHLRPSLHQIPAPSPPRASTGAAPLAANPRRACTDPDAINLRSSAFICGLFFVGAPDINSSEFIKVWTSQNSSLQNHSIHFSIRAHPCNPCNPCSIVTSLFAEAPQINRHLFINNRRAKYSNASGNHTRSPAPSFKIRENTPRVEM